MGAIGMASVKYSLYVFEQRRSGMIVHRGHKDRG